MSHDYLGNEWPDPAYGVNGGFPDDTWDGEWEGSAEQKMEEAQAFEPECDGACCACGEPIERTYVVTATIQLCIDSQSGVEAAIDMKDILNDIIATSDYANDPLNGALIDTVDDITVDL